MPITVPVPEEYAKPFDAKAPSTYDQHVAFTGPYMIKNDPKTGELTGWQPGKEISMVRNPNWDKATDFRPAYLDAIEIQEGNDDLATASRRALTGSKLICCDSGAPPAEVVKEALQNYKDQIAFVGSGGSRWIALNTTIKPLDNINIRKAIIAATDRIALQTDPRRGVPRGHRAGLHPARRARVRGVRRRQREHRPRLDGQPGGRRGGCAQVHGCRRCGRAAGQGRQVDRDGQAPDRRHQRRPRQEDRRGVPGSDREARLQAELPHRPAGRAVQRSSATSRRRRSRSAPMSGSSGTSTTGSR